MDQSVLAGVGNVFRAELLFRHGVSPFRIGRAIDATLWDRMWADLSTLMRTGVRLGRIVTTRPEHRSRRRGPADREDAHYVYRRTGLPCRVCGTEVVTEVLVGRNLYWCPTCQAG
jgi:formamidopyrimidine-DNA glycosylase